MGAAESLATLHPELGEQKMDFLERVAKGIRPLSAGLAVGWTPKRTREVLAEPGMASIISDAEEISLESLEEKLYKLARKGNLPALQLYLYCRGADRGWRPPTARVAIDQRTTVRIEVIEGAKAAVLEMLGRGAVAELQPGGALDDITDAELVE